VWYCYSSLVSVYVSVNDDEPLPTLKYRRIRGNVIEMYKYDDNTVHLDMNIDTRTLDILRNLLLRDVTMMSGNIHFVLELSTYRIVSLMM